MRSRKMSLVLLLLQGTSTFLDFFRYDIVLNINTSCVDDICLASTNVKLREEISKKLKAGAARLFESRIEVRGLVSR